MNNVLERLNSSDLMQGAITLVLLAISAYLFVYQVYLVPLLDFSIFYEAGERISAGEDIYNHIYVHKGLDEKEFELYYLYPPYLASILGLFVSLGYETVKLIWCLGAYLALIGFVLLSCDIYQRFSSYQISDGLCRIFFLFFMICFEPIYWGLAVGQVDAFVLFLLALFVWGLARDREHTAGVALGIAAAIKMSPALLVIGLLLWKRRSALISFVVAPLLLTLLVVALHGTHPFIDFVTNFSFIASGRGLDNYIFNFAFDRALLAFVGLEGSQLCRSLVKFALLALVLLMVVRFDREKSSSELRIHAVLIATMLLLSPIMWFQHLSWLLIPVMVLMLRTFGDADLKYRHWTFVAGVFFLGSQTNLFHYQTMTHFPQFLILTTLLPTICAASTIILLIRWDLDIRAGDSA